MCYQSYPRRRDLSRCMIILVLPDLVQQYLNHNCEETHHTDFSSLLGIVVLIMGCSNEYLQN